MAQSSSRGVSFITVGYFSAEYLERALTSLRREAAALGVMVEAIVVDHSESAAEEARLAALQPDQLLARPNRGYAAGLNAGLAAAKGEIVLLGNPDVEFLPGALTALLAALDAGFDVVGPQFELGGALFPLAEEQTPRAELVRASALRSMAALRRHLGREARRSQRAWGATEVIEQRLLSGALLATRRDTARRIGAWDEGYFLYFEEVDWLVRARRLGLRLGLAPGARVSHAWGHAARPAAQEEQFERSRRRYFERAFPGWREASGHSVEPMPTLDGLRFDPALVAPAPGWLWLVSPSPWGFPAAGLVGVEPSRLPEALERFAAGRSHGGALTLSAYDPETRSVLGPMLWEPPAPKN